MNNNKSIYNVPPAPSKCDSALREFKFRDIAFPVASFSTSLEQELVQHVVGVFDPGDEKDMAAGVKLCFNGVCDNNSVMTDGGMRSGAGNYANPLYLAKLFNGTAPLRFGAAKVQSDAWSQFHGNIDEFVMFDYKLTDQQIAGIYEFHN